MRFLLYITLFLIAGQEAYAGPGKLTTPYEAKGPNYTATYQETIEWYRQADKRYKNLKLLEYGQTDAGLPLHLAVLDAAGDFTADKIRKKDKPVILVLNAIHAGEPEGVDASMMLLRDLADDPQKADMLKKFVLIVIPMYNVEGALNRNSHSRANQDGPTQYGFRGNGQNLDLNRDFIKCDSRNARAFVQLFREWMPDVLIDNHTSNGADYTYTLTLIQNHLNDFPQSLSRYANDTFTRELKKDLLGRGYPVPPYVETMQESPDSGLAGFLATPRYSTGYAALWNTVGYTVETHMLKPFDQRLKATYHFMAAVCEKMSKDGETLHKRRKAAFASRLNSVPQVLEWKYDVSRFDSVQFLGYMAGHKASGVSGLSRLYYDRDKPYDKKVRYYNYFQPVAEAALPKAYILPQSWWRVAELLRLNGVHMEELKEDVRKPVSYYRIADYKTPTRPYEGHYPHSQVKIEKLHDTIAFRKGDLLIRPTAETAGYLLAVLEPQAPDSYFAWNYFDAILQQKEYFSSYVFEDIAAKILAENPKLKSELEARRRADAAFAADARAQLDFVYRNSPYYEPTHLRYPVFRVNE